MTAMVTVNTGIVITPELWSCNVMPEGILESWLVTEGSTVRQGDAVATIRIEDCMHKMVAPASGRLQKQLSVNSVVEPGTVIGQITRSGPEYDHFQLEV